MNVFIAYYLQYKLRLVINIGFGPFFKTIIVKVNDCYSFTLDQLDGVD